MLPSGGTLTALRQAVPSALPCLGSRTSHFFLTLANQIRQRSDLCLRSLFFLFVSSQSLVRWRGKIELGICEFTLIVRAIDWFECFMLC